MSIIIPKADMKALNEKIYAKVERLIALLNIISKLHEELTAYKLLLTTEQYNLLPYLQLGN